MVSARRRFTLAVAAMGGVAIVLSAAPASASTFAATELSYDDALLSQFNVVALGTLNAGPTASSLVTTSGRVVAGTLTAGANGFGACVSGCSGNTSFGASSSTTAGLTTVTTSNPGYGALTVFGNATGYFGATGGGSVYVNGNISGNPSIISGANTDALNVVGTLSSTTTAQDTPTYNTTKTAATRGGTLSNVTATNYSLSASTVFPFASISTGFKTPLQNLYAGLANLPGTPGVTAQSLPSNQSGVFTAGVDYTANGKSYGVVTTTLANFEAEGSSFTGVANGSSDAATFVIITGSGGTLPTITNADPKVIYDFVSASSLATSGTFDGTILAPLANLVQGSGAINGSVVVASLTQNASILNTNAFTGDLSGLSGLSYNARVPEPASIALFGSGIAGLAWLRRRRGKMRV